MEPATYRRPERVAAWTLVAVQLALLAGLVLVPGDRMWSVPWWLVAAALVLIVAAVMIGAAGASRLGSGLTASPLPTASAQLRVTGVYACVRHPIYAGLLLGGAGLVLLGGRVSRVGVWFALLLLLWLKARFEERRLVQRFPEYRAYASTTPRLLPDPRRCWRQ